MKTRIYTIFDDVAVESSPLFLQKNDAMAIRQLEITKDKIAEKGLNPEDYKLFCIGKFDTETLKCIPEVRRVIPVNTQDEEEPQF